MCIAAIPVDSTSLHGVTTFGHILDGLAARLGSDWYIEATRTCDGTGILLVVTADDEVDQTLTVTETSTGFVLEEMKDDRLRRIGDRATRDEVSSLVTRHLFKASIRLGFALEVRSPAA